MAIFVDFRTEIGRSQNSHFLCLSIAKRRHTTQSDLVFFNLSRASCIFGRIDIKWVTLMRAGARYVNSIKFQLVPVRSPSLLEQNFLKGVSLIFFASKQYQIALMKHLAAFESIPGSRPCCGWQDVTLCESVPVMPNWPHTDRARCPAEDQRHYHYQDYQICDLYSSNFAWLTRAHVREAEHWQQESWKLREQWARYRFKYETQCCLGHLGQGVAGEKEMSSNRGGITYPVCLWVLLYETVALVLCFCWNIYSDARWCHPKASFFTGSTISRENILF